MKKKEDEEVESAGLAGLVLDLQPRLLDSVAERNALAGSVETFARSMVVLGVPLCLTEQVPDKLGPTEEGILTACGETPICVYLTAVDAVRRGMVVTVLVDCVGCRRPEDGEWALRKMEKLGCHLLPLESLLYAILKSARHKEFRSISALVKDRPA